MKEIQELYNIHNLVTISVRRKAFHNFVPELSQPYSYFLVDQLNTEPNITLEIGKFTPDLKGSYFVDHKYFVRENYFYCEDEYKTARWKIEIEGFETGLTTIRVDARSRSLSNIIAPGLLPLNLILRQVIGYHLSKKGFIMVHGGAVSLKNKVLLFFGRGGTYKTTHLMNIMRSDPGWKFLGDDTVVLGQNQVLGFPTSLEFFAYRYHFLQTEHLSFIDRIRLVLHIATHKRSDDVKLTNQGEPRALIHCKAGINSSLNLTPVDSQTNLGALIRESLVEDHTNGSIGHASVFPRYVEAYSYVYPDNQIKRRWSNALFHLCAQFNSTPSYELEIPYNMSSIQLQSIIKLIEECYFEIINSNNTHI